jgi:hypothetical protein
VILLGNLNYRMRVEPAEMFERIQRASIACQTQYEEERELLRGEAGLEWNWRRGMGYNRFWRLDDPECLFDSPSAPPFLRERHDSDVGGWGVGLADIPELEQHRGRHPHDRGAPPSPRLPETAWAWVKEKDVLSQRMAKGLLFTGFREAPISFPPTFKFRVGASAEDYTERGALEAAYVTGARRANAQPQWSPSYTDRILVHSLGDIKHRCILGPYDMCDEGLLAQISDHRPVSLALAVLVDTSQLPSVDDLGQRARRHSRDSSDTATAMALATIHQQHGRHHTRSRSLGRMEQLLTLQLRPSSGSRAFPLLVCMALSRFRFTFRGFDVLCMERTCGACGASPGGEKGEKEEEVKEAQIQASMEEGRCGEDKQPGQLPPPPPLSGTTSRRSWLHLPSFKRSGSGSSAIRREARAAVARREAEEDLSIIDHMIILYPLPCGRSLGESRVLCFLCFGSTHSSRPFSLLIMRLPAKSSHHTTQRTRCFRHGAHR